VSAKNIKLKNLKSVVLISLQKGFKSRDFLHRQRGRFPFLE
jgi:hypothetical protein